MNPEALRKKRLEEIEQKRKRLEEMKKSRSSQDSVPSSTPLPQTSSPPITSEASVNDSAQSLLKKADLDEKNDTNLLISKLLQENGSRRNQPDKAKQFSIVKSSSCFTFMPKEIVKYDKECQFDCDECFETTHEVEKREDIAVNNYRSIATHDSNKNRKFNNYESKCDSTSFSHKNVLSEEEKSLLQKDTRFLHFFHAACLKVERALEFEEKFDIFKNYSMDTEIQSSVDSSQNSFEQVCTYSELSLLGRPITELRWSPFVADLFLVAYGAKDSATIALESNRREEDKDDHFGAVCLWSRDMHTRPERKFVTSSPVLTVMFHPTEAHYIIGGCENGQVVLWDLKELKLTPVQRSNLTGKGHKHPVCGLSSITTGSAACEVVSISVDGMLCHWDMARMNDPIVTLQLTVWNQNLNAQVQGSKDLTTIFSSPIRAKAGMYNTSKEGSSLNISCFTVGQGHQNQFIVVGNGVGDLFKSEYPFKTGMVSQQHTSAHFGLITAVHMHPLTSSHSYKDLFLTASIDWVVKLWSSSDLSSPICEFLSPTCEYQCDVQWCPVHPGVFVSISSSGKLCLWNLFKCLTEPMEVIDLRSTIEGNSFCRESGSAQVAFNKITWSKDGQSIFIADSRGELFRLKLQGQILHSPHNMEENHLEALLLRSSSRIIDSKIE